MGQKVFEKITNLIIKKMEDGVVPWKRPWNGSTARLGQHKSAHTGKAYRGANAFLTHLSGYDSPEWLTFKQAKDKGFHVKKGERGTPILFWNWMEKKGGTDPKTGMEEDGTEHIPFVRYYTVFNAQQIDGMEDKVPETKDIIEFNPIGEAEKILEGFSDTPKIVHEKQRAFYNSHIDLINLPKKGTFNSTEEYYSTLFHELGHSTGHVSRLGRKTLAEINAFGDHAYSKEELVAEITSAFLCGKSGIGQKVIDNQAAYIDGWLGRLKKDPKLFVHAAQQAQKAADYIAGEYPASRPTAA